MSDLLEAMSGPKGAMSEYLELREDAEIIADIQRLISDTKPARLQIATQIMAGFCANPAVFAPHAERGWLLVNCDEPELVSYCEHIAELLLESEKSKGETK